MVNRSKMIFEVALANLVILGSAILTTWLYCRNTLSSVSSSRVLFLHLAISTIASLGLLLFIVRRIKQSWKASANIYLVCACGIVSFAVFSSGIWISVKAAIFSEWLVQYNRPLVFHLWFSIAAAVISLAILFVDYDFRLGNSHKPPN